MSNPGYFYGDQQQQPSMQQRLALALMNGGGQNMNAAYGGMGSGGSQIASAIALRNMMNQQNGQQFAQQRINAAANTSAPVTPQQVQTPSMFGLGGGQ